MKKNKQEETPESLAVRSIRLAEKLKEEVRSVNEAAIFEEDVLEQEVKKMVEEGHIPHRPLDEDRLAAIKEALEYVFKQNALTEGEPEQEKQDRVGKTYEETLADFKLKPIIREEIWRVRQEPDDFVYQKVEEEDIIKLLDSIPDANNEDEFERIAGKLGIKHEDDGE